MATSLKPLLDRCYEVLTEGRGVVSPLPSGYYGLGIHPAMEPSSRAVVAREHGRACWVGIDSMRRVEMAQPTSSRMVYRVMLGLMMSYALPAQADHASMRALQANVAFDAHRVAAALQPPVNMKATEAAVETGCPGGVALVEWSLGSVDLASSLIEVRATAEAVVVLEV